MTTSSTGLRSMYNNPEPITSSENTEVPLIQEDPIPEEKPIITPIEIPVDEEIIEYFVNPPKHKAAEIAEKVGWAVLIGGAIASTLISIFQLLS